MRIYILLLLFFAVAACSNSVKQDLKKEIKDVNSCQKLGPQTPRDISKKEGVNKVKFAIAPDYSKMNLCNIHFHKNAEHKGPEFSVFKGESETGGYACNQQMSSDSAKMKPVTGACKGISVGDTVEVHWVHTSCNIKPGPTLGSCLADDCKDPVLKVETQVFLLVNDSSASDFSKFGYKEKVGGFHQAGSLPDRAGAVKFLGSTTGPKYNNKTCSPLQVNWSVSPKCNLLDINTLHKWCESNIFKEDHAHGVRTLVTNPEFLSEIM